MAVTLNHNYQLMQQHIYSIIHQHSHLFSVVPFPPTSPHPQHTHTTLPVQMTLISAALLYVVSIPSAVASRFSYVQVPHIKLKAEHQALVLFHLIKIVLAYWEGWRDGKRKRRRKDDGGEAKKRKKRRGGKGRGKRKGEKVREVVGKRYTVVFL